MLEDTILSDAVSEPCMNPECNNFVPDHHDKCRICWTPNGFPNVKIAERSIERMALSRRYEDALATPHAIRHLNAIIRFEEIARRTSAVLTMQIGQLYQFFQRGEYLFGSFTDYLYPGDENFAIYEFQQKIQECENALHPGMSEKLLPAVLTSKNVGPKVFGDYNLTLADSAIARRASVLISGPVSLCDEMERTGKVHGFRASWARRNRLVVIKFYEQLTNDMAIDALQNMLIDDTLISSDNFVRVYIYGKIDPDAVEELTGPDPEVPDRMWNILKSRFSRK